MVVGHLLQKMVSITLMNLKSSTEQLNYRFGKCLLIAKAMHPSFQLIQHAIRASGSEVVELDIKCEDGDKIAKCAAEQFQDQTCDWILVGGGDGSLNLAINTMFHLGNFVPLVICPLGTGNDFVRNLVIDPTLAYTPDSEFQPDFKLMDVVAVRINDGEQEKLYANMLSVGNGAEKADQITEDAKAAWGTLVYIMQFWKTVTDIQTFEATLYCDDDAPVTMTLSDLFVANGRTCGGGRCVVPDAKVDDGQFELVAIREGDNLQGVHLVQSFFAQQHLKNELVYFRRLKKLIIDCGREVTLTTDGEHDLGTRFQLESIPRAVPVMVCQPHRMNGMISAITTVRASQSLSPERHEANL